MCTDVFDNEEQLTKGFREFSREFKQLEQKDEAVIEEELDTLMENSKELFKGVGATIKEVKSNIDMIYTPTFVVQAEKDEMINKDSANYIYNNVESTQKEIKWYPNSGHVITMDKEKEQLHEDIYMFLENLNWEV